MKILVVLLLLCIASSSFAVLFSKHCPSNVYAVHHAQDVSNVRNGCICPNPNHGYQVAHVLHKQNADLERVVVFYYRDKTNNKVYMYTPSGDKQLDIPELQYDTEDDLNKIENQITIQLFDKGTGKRPLQTYQQPNHYQHLYHQQSKPTVTHSKIDSYSPQAWYHSHTFNNRLRSKGYKPKYEEDNGGYLSQYVPFSLGDETNWAVKNKIIHSHKIQELASDNARDNTFDFDVWYSQNAIKFPELYSGEMKYLSYSDLREQLLRILNEHGYIIIDNLVFDPQGEVVKSSNYQLVRVKIKQENDNKQVSSEVDGIMFLNLFPMTIIGVVPLTNNIEEIEIERSVINEVSDKQDDGKFDVKTDQETNVTQYFRTNEAVTTETPETSSTTEPGPLNALLKNLVHAVNSLVPNRREADVDAPGYRIIGGNAATGSGAPISSKGRSGTPY